MHFQFSNELILFLLPPLLFYFWWQHHHTLCDLAPTQRYVALGLRCLLATLLVLALAETRLLYRNDRQAVLFLVDLSKSVRSEQRGATETYIRRAVEAKRPQDQFGILTFAQTPHLSASIGSLPLPSGLHEPGVTAETDIAQALRYGRNELTAAAPASNRRIVLLSDGNENVAHALQETSALVVDHIPLDTVTLAPPPRPEALITKIAAPAHVKIGEPFSLNAVIQSSSAQHGSLQLMRDGRPVGLVRELDLHPGKNVARFEQQITQKGFARYSLILQATADTVSENNRGEALVWVQGKPVVLYIADDPSRTAFLRTTLQRQDITVEYAAPAELPTTATALQRFDCVLLSNVGADRLTVAQMQALQVSCRDFGVGFGMIGGENSFGAGGYRNTPIEEILPVSLENKQRQNAPEVAVALVIDRSGSMGGGMGDNKLGLAREAAIQATEALKPADKVAVIAFASEATIPVPLTLAQNRQEIATAIGGIQAGGGTAIYEGMRAAYEILKNDSAPTKHIILLTDGESQDPDYTSLLAAMQQRQITLSVIAIAPNPRSSATALLASLTQKTGGRFFAVDNARQLPAIYLQEIERISSPSLVEEPFRAQQVPADEIMHVQAISESPPLLGYNVATLKPTAHLSLIASQQSDPLLAGWRYGLGRSVAFLSDDRAKWGAYWQSWSGNAGFWAQLVRWTLRPSVSGDGVQVTLEGARGHIVVDALDAQGHYRNGLTLQARIAGPPLAGKIQEDRYGPPLRQIAPGRYEAWFDAPQAGAYLVSVQEATGRNGTEKPFGIAGIARPYAAEYQQTTADSSLMRLLARAGNGRAEPAAQHVFGKDRTVSYLGSDMTWILLLLAMLLLPVDIAARRLVWNREDLLRLIPKKTVDPEADRQSNIPSPDTVATPTEAAEDTDFARLMEAKRRARHR